MPSVASVNPNSLQLVQVNGPLQLRTYTKQAKFRFPRPFQRLRANPCREDFAIHRSRSWHGGPETTKESLQSSLSFSKEIILGRFALAALKLQDIAINGSDDAVQEDGLQLQCDIMLPKKEDL
ncbi:hypothetical protein ACLOJK_032667 [Asimina triloba]